MALAAEQVRTVLRTSWQCSPGECVPLPGARRSMAWRVSLGSEWYVAKCVPASRRARFESGLRCAEHLDGAGFAAGTPRRAADGALTVVAEGEALALLHWVAGRPLSAVDPMDQQWWGITLATAHRALRRFSHPQLAKFQAEGVRPDSAHLGITTWLRPAVVSARAALSRLFVTDQLTYGVLHADPAPEEFRLDDETGRLGLLDWGSIVSGPLVYDLASAVLYAGGTDAAGELLDGYLSTGALDRDECEAALPVMLRFRAAVVAGRLAERLAAGAADAHPDALAELRPLLAPG